MLAATLCIFAGAQADKEGPHARTHLFVAGLRDALHRRSVVADDDDFARSLVLRAHGSSTERKAVEMVQATKVRRR